MVTKFIKTYWGIIALILTVVFSLGVNAKAINVNADKIEDLTGCQAMMTDDIADIQVMLGQILTDLTWIKNSLEGIDERLLNDVRLLER